MIQSLNTDKRYDLYFKVPFREEFLQGMPFSLKSRNAVATIFSFYGDSVRVGSFMQEASH